MPIHVICPKCHARFTVGDQHAGKTGPCPKCKGPIKIPELSDQVVIHAPESEAGAKDAKGRNVLKPIRRKETKFKTNTALAVGGAVLLTVAIAFLIGHSKAQLGNAFDFIVAGGALLLGPPLAYAGYSFLRDDELEAYTGVELLVRCLACGAVYALLWGVYWFLGYFIFGSDAYASGLEPWQLGVLLLVIVGVGTFTAYVSFDLEPITALFHYALYLASSVLLRTVMMLSLLPAMASGVKSPGLGPVPQQRAPAGQPAQLQPKQLQPPQPPQLQPKQQDEPPQLQPQQPK
jgi:hypothetical protein